MKTNTFRTISKYLLPLGVIAMLFSLTACNLPFKVVWNDQQPEHVEMEAPENEGEPHPEENFGEEEPPPPEPMGEEEPPPPEPMGEEEAIKQALLAELGANEGEMEIIFGRMDEHFAEGGVIEANAPAGGGQWLAAKDNGHWVIVHHGQDLPPCDAVNAYNFPTDWVSQCWDAASGNAVNR